MWLIAGALLFGSFIGFLTGFSRSADTYKNVAIALVGGGIPTLIEIAVGQAESAGEFLVGFSIGCFVGFAVGSFFRKRENGQLPVLFSKSG